MEVDPKTEAGRRSVGIPRTLCEELRAWLGDRRLNPDAYVFVGANGAQLRHNLFYARYFRPAVRAALPESLAGLRFHDLRHTCAAILVARGAHPKEMAEWLGHSSVQITLDRYSHLMPHLSDRLTARLDEGYRAAASEPPPVAEVVPLR